ncbi:hypothetical protein OS493_026324 [Desmophyllum pertusum]|uniref:Uncharacterized protein n=1 Tax=Desmophyllum pertusum TaxID=174260 RepID=A0A9X0D1V2_9CNID|nr:hypothetical protein OS493_026324 [Desmophyllum pertusum]
MPCWGDDKVLQSSARAKFGRVYFAGYMDGAVQAGERAAKGGALCYGEDSGRGDPSKLNPLHKMSPLYLGPTDDISKLAAYCAVFLTTVDSSCRFSGRLSLRHLLK